MRVPHTHSPSPAGPKPSSSHLRSTGASATKRRGGRGGQATRGSRTHEIRPQSPGPGRGPPPPTHTHTPEPSPPPTATRVSPTPDTHPLALGPQAASPLARVPTRTPTRTFVPLPPHFPGDALLVLTLPILLAGRKTLYLILFFWPRRSNSSHFPAAGETHTHKHARARTRPPQMLPLRSRGRRRKHKHPRAGLAPARPEGKPPRQAGPGPRSRGGGRARRPGLGSRRA